MTDKVQLIKEEIERQIEEGKVKCQQSQENNDRESFVAWSEHVATCGKILLFIDSIPENNNPIWHKSNESPIKGKLFLYETNQNIVDLIRSNGKEMPDWCNRWAYLDDLLKIDSLPEEPASEDLDEAAEKYAYNEFPSIGIPNTVIELAFKKGAEWEKQRMKETLQTEYDKGRLDMREEMMKDSVEGIIHHSAGDKVKIIIIKED